MIKRRADWPRGPVSWTINRTIYVSVPFTWDLPAVKESLKKRSGNLKKVILGGPGVYLMPGFFDDLDFVQVGYEFPGVLQAINPNATRTTTGCVRKCGFCAIGTGRIENGFKCLDDWPDLPVICDNNLLAAPISHFDRVIERLKKHQGVDFNQGLDARLLTAYHAERISGIKGIRRMGVRLALDGMGQAESWQIAFDRLRSVGVAKYKISSYALIGFDSGPDEAWERCSWVESHKIKVLPMWYHSLSQLEKNIVTDEQKKLGWNDYERRRIMQWFYKHKKAVEGNRLCA